MVSRKNRDYGYNNVRGPLPPTRPAKRKGFVQPGAIKMLNKLLGDDKDETMDDIFGGKVKPEEEPSLADMFVAATHSETRGFAGRAKKIAAEALLRYRIDMHKAHRFVLTDEFTEMATMLSFASPEKTLARLQYATIPYDTTWIEFNLHAKMQAIHRRHAFDNLDLSKISPRLGLLLQRVNDTSAVCTLISAIEGFVMPHASCYFFSTTEMNFDRKVFGCMPLVPGLAANLNRPFNANEEEARRVTKASLWGYSGKSLKEQLIEVALDDMVVPPFLEQHGDAGFGRMHAAYAAEIDRRGDGHEKIASMVVAELQEFTGTIRWLVTVLAMLNEVPVSTEKVERTSYMRSGRLGKSRMLDYHKVSIRLPKTNPLTYYERKLSHAEITRRRAHEVRTHWRTYLHEKRCGYEEHAWEYDHEHGYRLCGKCEAYGRLIHEHIRGDVNLGWVRKDYVIKSAQEQGR
jgi:hypothetical protein